MTRYLAVLIYLLAKGEAWVDRGAKRFEQRRIERETGKLTDQSQCQRIHRVSEEQFLESRLANLDPSSP